MTDEDVVWRASEEVDARSNTRRFMSKHGIETYEDLVRRSCADPEWFWPEAISYLGIPFIQPYETVRDLSEGKPFGQWFPEGRVNQWNPAPCAASPASPGPPSSLCFKTSPTL